MCSNATPTAKLQTVVVRTKQNETFSLWSQWWSSGLFGNTTTPETLVGFCGCRCYEVTAGYVILWGGWRSDVVSFLGRISRGTWRGTRRCNHHCRGQHAEAELCVWSDGIHFYLSLVHSCGEKAHQHQRLTYNYLQRSDTKGNLWRCRHILDTEPVLRSRIWAQRGNSGVNSGFLGTMTVAHFLPR